jgi:2-polyprenyl-6-hydroxyphenyl methylase/3-demethylubiquinone-9 3-methyltransferase
MQTISNEIYDRIDNRFYNAEKDIWWDENSFLSLLKTSFNPCRFGYFLKQYSGVLKQSAKEKTALDVGCGGGVLAEEFAAAGFEVTGMDPSENSIRTAVNHARQSGLNIRYETGVVENLPYPDNSFDVVYCCDVLEHVRDLNKAIAEISRVLKRGGMFFFDTINRTGLSKLIIIKIWQEWRATALVQPGLHVYEMFIKPEELKELCFAHGMEVRQLKGMSPNVNPIRLISLLRQRAKGRLTFSEFGKKVRMIESNDLKVGYMGYAVKK